MWDDFISRQIRRTNRNLFLTGAFLLALLGLVAFGCWRDVNNFVFGPFPMQTSELVTIMNPAYPKHYFVKVEGEEASRLECAKSKPIITTRCARKSSP